jgi:hypothetical protein
VPGTVRGLGRLEGPDHVRVPRERPLPDALGRGGKRAPWAQWAGFAGWAGFAEWAEWAGSAGWRQRWLDRAGERCRPMWRAVRVGWRWARRGGEGGGEDRQQDGGGGEAGSSPSRVPGRAGGRAGKRGMARRRLGRAGAGARHGSSLAVPEAGVTGAGAICGHRPGLWTAVGGRRCPRRTLTRRSAHQADRLRVLSWHARRSPFAVGERVRWRSPRSHAASAAGQYRP